MTQVYYGALRTIMSQIKVIGQRLSTVSDQYELVDLQNRLNLALNLKGRIEKRIKTKQNVLYIDFKNKKRVA